MYAYLDRPVRALAEADIFLVFAMRGWVAAARGGRCVCHALAGGFRRRGVAAALADFATAMALIDRAGLTQLRFAPVVWPKVTDDEAHLLALFALGRGRDTAAIAALAATLVEAEAVPRLLTAVDTVGCALMGDGA